MTEAEQRICTAPRGMVRLVHTDPRDHQPTEWGDYTTRNNAEHALGEMMSAQRDTMAMYDDRGGKLWPPT
jgi:hypothetical protein